MDAQIRKRAGICIVILLLLALGSLTAIILRIGAIDALVQDASGQGSPGQSAFGQGASGQEGVLAENFGQTAPEQGGFQQDTSGQEASKRKLLAEIYQDGVLVDRIDLNAVDSNYQLEYTSQDGGRNVVEVSSGRIRILEADCPDKLCVKQGFLPDSLLPLVCLPHRLVIQLAPETAIDDSPEGHASGSSGALDSGTSDSAAPDTKASDSSELDAIVH